MTPPAIFIRIDQPPVGSNFRFEAQVCIGDEDAGMSTGFKSPIFEKEDEHDSFVQLMQLVTQSLLQVREFKKKATEKDFYLLNAQGRPLDEKPVIITA